MDIIISFLVFFFYLRHLAQHLYGCMFYENQVYNVVHRNVIIYSTTIFELNILVFFCLPKMLECNVENKIKSNK